ncbi:AbrB/MazE/SpoVT family DNA-binding domain-containing protein [Endozoicomonas sp. SM1973]|uniref:AbrB/MazE/SpoVT family DNA-binding domain-containing protein n=1 Tax=Spartinivicinus marinus TaxID=2994442 RepID=A0A853IHV2_9GAMM|nr:AbrB/MazE/SpoVT family DNA-binding domain-containing protein [Spartinivicinus marinus]NYZ69631.1 AbrB/MazE/SpoVT family DNA-binding domain-containing protein [Spartinivicinus marinus]
MATGKVITANQTQTEGLPKVKKVAGKDSLISPAENCWDSYFLSGDGVTEDFMAERSVQEQPEREDF